jgi:polysaccharide chain length determinant protein (PEP-CTERM system associated)
MYALIEKAQHEFRGAWRYRWAALIVAWVVCLMGWAVVIALPNTYAASARVFVDTRTTLSQVTQGLAVESNVESQIQRVRQALLAGPQLDQVARETGLLDPRVVSPQQRQAIIAKLKERVEISVNAQNGGASGMYVISYADTSRERAEKVVERLLNDFVDNTLGGKKQSSKEAQQFLEEQIKEDEKRLSDAEERLANFKRQNVGMMPGAQGDYFVRLQTEVDGLDKARAALAIAIRRRDEIRRQLHGEQPFVAGGAPVSPAVGAPPATGRSASGTLPAGGDLGGADTETRIRETQARLDDLLLRFTDKHPDVIALRQTLTQLKQRQQEEIEAARKGDLSAQAGLGLSANPVFQSIQLQLNQAEVDIAALTGEIADRENKIASLRRRVDTAPEIEAQFARLNRDYDVTRTHYQALVDRLGKARLGEEAEATGVVRFEVVDPPGADFAPVAPNRNALIPLVLLLGLGAGGTLAYVLHQIWPVFSTPRQLAAITGLPVLGVVSLTWLEKNRALAKRGLLAFAGTGAMLLLTGAFLLAAQYRAVRLVHDWLA